MVKVGVAGGSGYGGIELVQILYGHPEAEIVWLSSEQYAGEKAAEIYPHLGGFLDLRFSSLKGLDPNALDVLFLALPHGQAMKIVPALPSSLLIIDLSGDFRINDPNVFKQYYGFNREAEDTQREFVYGLPEINREAICSAHRIANPGCFATATLLALHPLYREAWIEGPVYVDSKTGSSGSGRSPSAKTHHPKRSQSFSAYRSFNHQHLPEMRQILSSEENQLIFQPHSAPMVRGILASHYMRLREDPGDVKELYADYYGESPFVRWVTGSPDVSSVLHSNFTDIGAASADRFLIVWSALDNLQKGAAGQAVQNMNLACGFPETAGIDRLPAFP
jgi:N-acetyl-gamma-glutamyl-phosphate reductase